MAYAYNAIDDLIQENPKQDIFGQSNQQQQQQQPQSQGQVKTSTDGQVQSQGQSPAASTQQQSVAQPAQDPYKASQDAYRANAGKTQQPAAIGNLQQQLSTNSQRLQDEANSYVTNQKANQNYAVDQGSLQSATTGDQASSDKVRNLLGTTAAKPVEDFNPHDVTVKDLNLLNTNAGLQNLVSRGQGPQYTSGMGAFDVRSLKSNPNFKNIVNMIQSQQTDLSKKAQDLAAQKKQEVEQYGQTALEQAQKNTRDYLGSQAQGITSAQAEEAARANANLDALRKKGDSKAEQQALADAKAKVLKDLQQADPRTAGLLGQIQVDPRKFANVANNYDAKDFATQAEAERFNNIMGLLGQGGQTMTAAGPLGKAYNIDQSALQNELVNSARNKRETIDTGLKSQSQAILDAAQKRADAQDAQRAALNLDDIARSQGSAALQNLDPELRKYAASGLVDPTKYISRPDIDLNARDVLNFGDISKLNSLQSQLGLQDRYALGQYANKNPQFDFNTAGYLSALTPYLQQRQQSVQSQQAQVAAEAQERLQQQSRAASTGAAWIPGISDKGYQQTPINLGPEGFTFANGISDNPAARDPVKYAQAGQLYIPGLGDHY